MGEVDWLRKLVDDERQARERYQAANQGLLGAIDAWTNAEIAQRNRKDVWEHSKRKLAKALADL